MGKVNITFKADYFKLDNFADMCGRIEKTGSDLFLVFLSDGDILF
jgi:hypothetical protein